MPYTLDNFTQQAPPTLLAQARALVAARAVTSLEKTDVEWLADVQDGDDLYTVAIDVGPHGELLSTCGCGDVENDLCRHALALLLTGAAEGKARPQPQARAKPAKAPAKNTVEARLRGVLGAAPPAALIDLLVSLAKADKHLQSRIYIELGQVDDSFESYTTAVQAALSPRGGHSAWSDTQKAKAAATQVNLLLQRAMAKASSGEADMAIRMALVVFEQIQDILNRVYGCRPIEESAERAIQLIQSALPQANAATRAAFMQSMVRTVTHATRIDTKRIANIKGILVELVDTAQERALVEPLLMPTSRRHNAYVSNEIWDAAINQDYTLHYALLARLDGVQAAYAFAKENVRYMSMRSVLLADAMARNDLTAAYALAGEGLRLSDKAYLNKVADMYVAQMVEIAEKRGESPSELYLRQFQREPDYAHWLRFKQSVPAQAWPKERTRVLRKFISNLPDQSLYMIYSTEEMWDKLLALMNTRFYNLPSAINILEGLGPKLAAAYPAGLAQWCASVVEGAAQRGYGDRESYRNIATILKLMAGMGLGVQAAAIAARTRRDNPNRDALLGELKGI